MSTDFKNSIKKSERRRLTTSCLPEVTRIMSWTVFPRIHINLQSSPTACNFNNSRPLYVILWEIGNHYRNIWFMKNFSIFYFWKNSPQKMNFFTIYSKGRHFSITKLDILIFRNILHLDFDFWNWSWKRIVCS